MEDKIKPLALTLHQKRLQLDKTMDDIKSIKTGHFIDVLEQSKDKDIAKELNLTNEKGREIELDSRLKQDPEYTRLDAVRKALENDIALLGIDLEHERNVFKVWYVGELARVNGVV